MANATLRLVAQDDSDKQRALEAALTQIDRAFGKGSVMKLGAKGKVVEIESVSTGSLGLDIALGIGGLPKGRIVEIYGPESSGKTTLALHVVAEVQKTGGTAAFIDAEHALDPSYAHKLGVNLDDLLVSQPDTGEQALEITDTLVRSGAVDIIVIDSVAALTPRAEIEGEMGDQLPGLQARLMSQALRKLTASISKAKTLVIFINQIRMKIGVMYGSPETTTGGNALKFYASVRLDIRRTGSIKQRDEIIGNSTRVKVVKNKVAPPFREVEFDIMYGEGISKLGEIIDLGVKAGVIEKSGSWFSFGSERIGQGRDNVREFLKANPDMAAEIERAVRGAGDKIEEELLVGPVEADDEDGSLWRPPRAPDPSEPFRSGSRLPRLLTPRGAPRRTCCERRLRRFEVPRGREPGPRQSAGLLPRGRERPDPARRAPPLALLPLFWPRLGKRTAPPLHGGWADESRPTVGRKACLGPDDASASSVSQAVQLRRRMRPRTPLPLPCFRCFPWAARSPSRSGAPLKAGDAQDGLVEL